MVAVFDDLMNAAFVQIEGTGFTGLYGYISLYIDGYEQLAFPIWSDTFIQFMIIEMDDTSITFIANLDCLYVLAQILISCE